MLEAPAIRVVQVERQEETIPGRQDFKPIDVNGLTRWVLKPGAVALARRGVKEQPEPSPNEVYCRECGQTISVGQARVYFRYRWNWQTREGQKGFLHPHH
jgi:hypothetical protein